MIEELNRAEYLESLAIKNIAEAKIFKDEYIAMLDSTDDYILEVGLKSLFMELKYKDDKIFEKTKVIIQSIEDDYIAKLGLSCLGSLSYNSRSKDLMNFFITIINDEGRSPEVKTEAFSSLLQCYGIPAGRLGFLPNNNLNLEELMSEWADFIEGIKSYLGIKTPPYKLGPILDSEIE